MMTFWPFDLDGIQFLMIYGLLFVAASILSNVVARLAYPAGREHRLTDPDQLALLSGGQTRLTEAIVTRMLVSGAIEHIGGGNFRLLSAEAVPCEIVRLLSPEGASGEMERDIVAMMPASLPAIQARIKPYGDALDRKLTHLGLLMTDAESTRLRVGIVLPLLLLGCLGFVRMIQGMINDRPVGFLIAFIIVTSGLAILRVSKIGRHTRAGLTMLEAAKGAYGRLYAAPTTAEMPMAVAMFGTVVLVGSFLGPLHAHIHRRRRGGSDSGSGGGSGGDGGGGGGCGGGGD
jgi:uncharacterized protein (TIGR04222 family)